MYFRIKTEFSDSWMEYKSGQMMSKGNVLGSFKIEKAVAFHILYTTLRVVCTIFSII